MSVDPTAAAAAGSADLSTLIDAELAQLAADGAALRATLVEDAVVTARVLPSNGLSDLLEIAGRRVAASLPPTVRPGDVLQVRVTGFDGERILVQIVGTGPVAAAPANPIAPEPAVFVAASIVPAQPPAAPSSPPLPLPGDPNAAAPAPAAPAPAATAPNAAVANSAETPPAPPATGAFGGTIVGATSAQNIQRPVVVATAEPTTIEARVAAAQATSPRAPSPAASAGVAPDLQAAPRAAPPIASQRFTLPPQIETKIAPPPAAPRPTGLAAYTEPVALLRALRLPVTPSNVASAALAFERPDRLPAALAALERALPRAASDPNVATLKTLLAFVGRIDPRSPVLATQIAAYVDHVVDGAEPKLATLLAASRAAAPEAPTAAAPAASANASQRANAAQTSPAAEAPQPRAPAPPEAPPVAAAVAVERGAALASTLKQTLLNLAAAPELASGAGPALTNALTALSAVQLNAAQTLAANPDGITFTIPLTTQHGTANAHISVKRDGPESRGGALDGENFRIAFVLETVHYDTIAIDLVTVGREVTVDVRTASAPALRAFRGALGALSARLEALRYRVASAAATLGTPTTIGLTSTTATTRSDPDANVDRSA